jgi:phospholipase D
MIPIVLFLLCLNGLFAAEKVPLPSQHAYFSPNDHIADHLIAMIAKEKKSIKAAVYSLTHRGVAQALAQAKNRGVEVEVIVDPFSLRNRSSMTILTKAGIPVLVWNPEEDVSTLKSKEKKKPLMHDKFCVFGKSIVWTGSFNFTYDADGKNEENVVVLEDAALASRFEEQFNIIKNKGTIPYEKFLKIHSQKQKNKE